jgi:mono/diheme cytochrome c family protein
MRVHKGLWLLLAVGVSWLVFTGAAKRVQSTAPGNQTDTTNLIDSVKGPDLYRAYCATCHGLEGKGNGPVGAGLKIRPADLTVMARNSNGKFPEARVRRVISGDEPSLQSHGSREMPVWGPIFHQIEVDQDFGNVRMQNLIKYLETIQQK